VRNCFNPKMIRDNPCVPTARDGLIGFPPGLQASGITWTNHRILQDDDFVVLHNSFTNTRAFGAPEIVAINTCRMENCQAAEHVDAIKPVVTPAASGRSMVDGATEIKDRDRTEANKAMAV
jgi:predicted SnoaL-like aldol condensation-catalyzing enzyme